MRNFEPIRVHFSLAMMYSDLRQFNDAVKHYLEVLKVSSYSLFDIGQMPQGLLIRTYD